MAAADMRSWRGLVAACNCDDEVSRDTTPPADGAKAEAPPRRQAVLIITGRKRTMVRMLKLSYGTES